MLREVTFLKKKTAMRKFAFHVTADGFGYKRYRPRVSLEPMPGHAQYKCVNQPLCKYVGIFDEVRGVFVQEQSSCDHVNVQKCKAAWVTIENDFENVPLSEVQDKHWSNTDMPQNRATHHPLPQQHQQPGFMAPQQHQLQQFVQQPPPAQLQQFVQQPPPAQLQQFVQQPPPAQLQQFVQQPPPAQHQQFMQQQQPAQHQQFVQQQQPEQHQQFIQQLPAYNPQQQYGNPVGVATALNLGQGGGHADAIGLQAATTGEGGQHQQQISIDVKGAGADEVLVKTELTLASKAMKHLEEAVKDSNRHLQEAITDSNRKSAAAFQDLGALNGKITHERDEYKEMAEESGAEVIVLREVVGKVVSGVDFALATLRPGTHVPAEIVEAVKGYGEDGKRKDQQAATGFASGTGEGKPRSESKQRQQPAASSLAVGNATRDRRPSSVSPHPSSVSTHPITGQQRRKSHVSKSPPRLEVLEASESSADGDEAFAPAEEEEERNGGHPQQQRGRPQQQRNNIGRPQQQRNFEL